MDDTQKDAFLHDLYFVKHNFVGRDKLFYLVSVTLNNKEISRRYISTWLGKQTVNQLYSQKKKETSIRPIITKNVGSMLQMDLIDFSNKPSEEGFRYILNCIDTFSRRVWLEPIYFKTTLAVIPKMNDIIHEIQNDGHSIKIIQSDNGNEFKIVFGNGIKHIFSKPHSPTEQGLVERSNGIIKRILNKYIYHEKVDWNADIILEVENIYNNTVNRNLGKTPDEIYALDEDEQKVQHTLQIKKKGQGYKEINTLLKVNDKVRLLIPTGKIKSKGQPVYSTEIYTIRNVIKGNAERFTIPRYGLSDSTDIKVKGNFPLSKLLLIS